MSLINDALKRARQSPSDPPPPRSLPLRPVKPKDRPGFTWLLPALIIFLVVVACFFIGLSMAHRTVMNIVNTPEPAVSTMPPVENVPAPEPRRLTVETVVSNEPPRLKVQGIIYDPAKPWAIISGQMVYVGDLISGFRVKAITKYNVTLVGTDGREKTIGLGE